MPGIPPVNEWLERMNPRINAIWRGAWKVGMVEPARFIFDHELVIVSKGRCRVQIDDETHDLQAGSFIIVPPGRSHATTAESDVQRMCIHFDWLRSQPPSRNPIWVYHPNKINAAAVKPAPAFVPGMRLRGSFQLNGPIAPLLESIIYRWRTGDKLDQAASHLSLAELLLLLLWQQEASPAQGAASGDRATQLAFAVKDLLDTAPRGTLEIQVSLASLGFSYAHLCRMFKAQFGLSPVRYLNAAKMERAKQLLQDPRLSISDVAYAVGFNHPSYFTRMFHSQNGVAPNRAR
ncbi:MAG TPA: AraC family transcriptional regulator [Candidatus Methylacidiphilales bacterium]|nr:AraC family transcriptional regulator [Candidatus Methylacidiphilales bacterium]